MANSSENKTKYPIKEDWKQYYFTLEGIRRTGVVNMWGAAPYLQACFPSDLSEEEARQILCNWIHNYDALNDMYHWQ